MVGDKLKSLRGKVCVSLTKGLKSGGKFEGRKQIKRSLT